MNNYGYIYKTTNLKNGKIYIGQRKGQFNPSYYGSGFILKRALEKEGTESFKIEILGYGLSREQQNELEKRFIAECRDTLGRDNVYNIADGGEGHSGPLSEEHKKKISRPRSQKGIINIRIGCHKRATNTEWATKQAKLAETRRGKTYEEIYGIEGAKLQRKIRKGKRGPYAKRTQSTKPRKPRSVESNAKLSETIRNKMVLLGYRNSPETRAKQSIIRKKYWEQKHLETLQNRR